MKTLKTFTLISLLTLGLTQSVFAAWWNPFTWHFGWFKRNAPTTQVVAQHTSDTQEESLQLTYSSTTKGFLFKYPNTTFEVREGVDNVSVYPVPQPIEFGSVLNIKITKITKPNLESEVNNFITAYKQVQKKSEVTINGTQWIKVEYKDISGAGPESDYVAYFTIYNNELYRAQYNRSTEANNTAFEKTISTLKFIEVVDSVVGRACGGGVMGNGGACPNGYTCDLKTKGPPAEGYCKKIGATNPTTVDTTLPKINSISPVSGFVGTVVEIKGLNLAGFEGDMIATFERADGKTVQLDSIIPRNGDRTSIKVKIDSPCKKGETVYGDYSGKPSLCDYFEFTPGVYKVYTSPWGKKSNVVTFVVTNK